MTHFSCMVTVHVLGFIWLLKYCQWGSEDLEHVFSSYSWGFSELEGKLWEAVLALSVVRTHTHTHTLHLWLPCTHWAGILCFLFMHHLQVAAMIPQHLHIIPTHTNWIRREAIYSVVSMHVCLCPLIAFNKQAKQEERWVHWVRDRKCTGVWMGASPTLLRLQQQPDRYALYSRLLYTVNTCA